MHTALFRFYWLPTTIFTNQIKRKEIIQTYFTLVPVGGAILHGLIHVKWTYFVFSIHRTYGTIYKTRFN